MFLLALANYPRVTLISVAVLVVVAWLLKDEKLAQPNPRTPPQAQPMTANGLPDLNEDWIGEEVLLIDDARIPQEVRQHGARFRNPARYAIELAPGEYALYGADGELLDLCFLE